MTTRRGTEQDAAAGRGTDAGTSGARIALLPEIVRDQIAAGEVVERPASVVKELVENALDAGAKRVVIDLEEGGARLVRITDDGHGMGAEDLALAFSAHATSKLRSVDDLDHIASLGFRGEALASIASVARCRIFSRPPEDELGRRIENEGGRLGAPTEAGGPAGTSVEVRDLFYNTPARRRFLKRTSTELARCLDVIQRAALAHEGVGFVATHDGKRLVDVEASMDLRARVRRLFGEELAEALEPVEAQDGDTVLSGYVAPPRFARRDTSRQMWFLNGRFLRDKILLRVLREAYRGYLADRQPVAFLRLAMDPGKVDVNVHPQKSEVRFREERRLFGFCLNHLREAVRRTDMATPGEVLMRTAERREGREGPTLPDPGPATFPRTAGAASPREPFVVREVPGRSFEPASPGREREVEVAPPAGVPAGADAAAWKSVDDFKGPYLQVDRTYLLRSVPGGFEIIDQHALHERVTFELLKRDMNQDGVEVQRQLVPEVVEVSPADVELIEGHLDALARTGLEIAVFGPRSLAVHGVPARLKRPDVDGLVGDVLAILARTGRAPVAEELLEEVLHRAACRSSVMAGDALDEDEIRALLQRAAELESDQTCPHGRPTRVRFTVADLEKAFHRR